MGDTEEKKEDEVIVEASAIKEEKLPDFHSVEVKNPKSERVLRLEKEIRSRHGEEVFRNKRLQIEQDYVSKMLESIEKSLKNEKDAQRQNDLFEERIRTDVYRMHGLSEDKLQGMSERRIAWIQGTAFALFFLSCVMVILCGALHGFGDSLTLFAAFFTAIEGTLLTNGKRRFKVVSGLIGFLYLILFPIILFMFVCREESFAQYDFLLSVFSIAGLAILVAGSVSYFMYNPYQEDARALKQANRYLKKMEKAASSDVRLREKTLEKEKKQEEKEAEKERRQKEKAAEKERRQQEKTAEKEKKRQGKEAAKEEKKAEKEKQKVADQMEKAFEEVQAEAEKSVKEPLAEADTKEQVESDSKEEVEELEADPEKSEAAESEPEEKAEPDPTEDSNAVSEEDAASEDVLDADFVQIED
jgi:hypothetical protein